VPTVPNFIVWFSRSLSQWRPSYKTDE